MRNTHIKDAECTRAREENERVRNEVKQNKAEIELSRVQNQDAKKVLEYSHREQALLDDIIEKEKLIARLKAQLEHFDLEDLQSDLEAQHANFELFADAQADAARAPPHN